MAALFVVGIDLGTTHTVVAYAEITQRAAPARPKIFDVPQLVDARAEEPRPLLPSVLYAPLPGEVEGDPAWVVGEFARRRGTEVIGRHVASAKSWLSYGAVDRLSPILPWTGAEDETPKVSPVDAGTKVLERVRDAWNAAHPEAPLAEQEVVLTLPASFDEVARVLTLRAAEAVGLAPTLLEEPTAAFYDALEDKRALKKLVRGGPRHVLVCDVGGGTTDLSLMRAAPAEQGEDDAFRIERVAVGRHILLGGDNMDLALAHVAEQRMALETSLAPAELGQLVMACRSAKERLLGGDVDEARVTVLGRGRGLVAGAKSTALDKGDVERVVVQGFFPRVTEADLANKPRSGIVSFGLPYEREPAITKHVLQFLRRHAADVDVVLLNGGVFHAEAIVTALLDAMEGWSGARPERLASRDPDLAVARGAVRYGLARRGLLYRVESSAARGYYVGLGAGSGEARAVCILPRGAREGERHEAGRPFELVVGQSVRFDLFASDVARDRAGDLVTVTDDFARLPPLVTHFAPASGERTIPVHLGGELLATGQLALSCTEARGADGAADAAPEPRAFHLEFQLRESAVRRSVAPPTSLAPQANLGHGASGAKWTDAAHIVDRVFGKKGEGDAREVKDVVRDLEKVLGERATWPLGVARSIADLLLTNPGARRRSANHERGFWLLLGYCLRPGFGDPGDEARVASVWPMFEGRLAFPAEARGWQQFFIAWRRIGGGMSEAMQKGFRDAMDPAIAPPDAGLKKPKRMPEARDELLATAASFERVPAADRARLGDWIVERTWSSSDARLWDAVGRIGARVPLYASVHHVVPVRNAEAWLERLLRAKWSDLPSAPHAAVQLARMTNDRTRDIGERLRGDVLKRLTQVGAREAWIRSVRELVEVDEAERVAILGEGLPLGLRLPER